MARGWLSHQQISVNFSIRQFECSNMTGLIEAVLTENGLPPECLEMEITESFIIKAEDAFRFLEDLRALGVHLAVDDFGTGYSSLMAPEALYRFNDLKSIDPSWRTSAATSTTKLSSAPSSCWPRTLGR